MAMIRRYCVLCRAQIIDHWCRGYVSYPSTMILNTCIIQDTRISIKRYSPTKDSRTTVADDIKTETDKVYSTHTIQDLLICARCTPSSICGLEEADRLSYVDAIRDNTIRILMIKDEAEEYYIMCVFYCVVFV
eukprot:1125204_1